jgi:hypothetical protein
VLEQVVIWALPVLIFACCSRHFLPSLLKIAQPSAAVAVAAALRLRCAAATATLLQLLLLLLQLLLLLRPLLVVNPIFNIYYFLRLEVNVLEVCTFRLLLDVKVHDC